MMKADLFDTMFHDEAKAREYFEAQRWPDGQPRCPRCGSTNVHRLTGKSRRAGEIICNRCLETFTVTIGTLMEWSHVPLTKWALAFHTLAANKRRMSVKQLQRELNLGSYRTAWFMWYRIREAMQPPVAP